ncbi:PIN domain-containing protein [Dactylosporangium sp. NPDC050688]|uniref:PIN domain-containing protein n=1 Tax=Dactylosporangium sp. NPDC050688 TaxID=3157217 RepID=UPI003404E7B6
MINAALQEFVDQQRTRRRQALQDLRRLSDEGAFNYDALGLVDKSRRGGQVKYLVDTSALIRLHRNRVSAVWDDLAERGLIAVCEPVLAEVMTLAEAKSYPILNERILALHPWAAVPDGIWSLVTAIRRELVLPGAYQGVSVADLVVAATAIRLKLSVLHEDGGFETMARYVPELRQRRISAGPE